MIGGTVVDVWKWHPEHVEIVVKGENSYCLGVRLEKTTESLCIGHGDSLWWQSDKALWTSKDQSMYLIGIKRLSTSYPVENCVSPERKSWQSKESLRPTRFYD